MELLGHVAQLVRGGSVLRNGGNMLLRTQKACRMSFGSLTAMEI